MKRTKYALFVLGATACVSLALIGCGGDTDDGITTPPDPSGPSVSDPTVPTDPSGPSVSDPTTPTDPKKSNYDMSGVGWDYTGAFTYDGTPKTVSVTGSLPSGVTVKSYADNVNTDAGTYTASVTFNYDAEKFNAPSIADCKYVINKSEIHEDIKFNGSTVEYDGLPHSIAIVGNVPSGAIVKYTCNGQEGNEFTAVGSYTVVCTITHNNYITKTLQAVLTIRSTEERLYSAVLNGRVYFQNNLDDNKLYSVSGSGSGLSKVNNDTPEYMTVNGNKLYYYSKSLLSKVVKSYDGSKSEQVYESGGEYLTTDGTYVYYAVNNTLINTSDNGIYKYKIGTTDAAVRLTSDKAAYLTYLNGKIYYSNLSESKRLYSVSVSANNVKGSELNDEEVSDIIGDGSMIYFNSTKTTLGIGRGSAITRYDPSDGTLTKLTTDSGKYLTKVGNEIYYINNDLITSTLFGDGIYKVNALKTGDSNLPGTKVISIKDNGYSSLSSDGDYLYYYKLNDKHFYRSGLNGNNETDLMSSFTPVDDTTLIGNSELAVYNGEVYYTNPLDNGCLYKYNPTTRSKIKVLSNSVSDIAFNENYMYYTTYIATNYALFRMDLTTSEIIKISSDRCENLVFDDDLIYYVKRTAASNELWQMNPDGTEDTMVYDGKQFNTNDFYKRGNEIIFNHNPKVGYQYILKYNIETKQLTDPSIKAKNFCVIDDKIYYYASDDSLKVCALDFSGSAGIKTDVTVNDMFAYGNSVYFSSDNDKNSGLFKYDITTKQVTKLSDKQAHGFAALDDRIYFLQSNVSYVNHYPSQSQKTDGKLYCYDGNKVTMVA